MEKIEDKALSKVILKELGQEYCEALSKSVEENEKDKAQYDETLDTDLTKVRTYINRINGKNQINNFDIRSFFDRVDQNLIEYKEQKTIEEGPITTIIEITKPKLLSDELTEEEILGDAMKHYCEQLSNEVAISNYVYDSTKTLVEAKLEEMYRMPTEEELEIEGSLQQYIYPIKEILYYKDNEEEKILPIYNVKDKKPIVIGYDPIKIEQLTETTIEAKSQTKDKLSIIKEELKLFKKTFPSEIDDSYRKDSFVEQEQSKNMDNYLELKQRGRFLEDEIKKDSKIR